MLGLLVLLSLMCTAGVVSLVLVLKQPAPASDTVQQYYSAIEQHNYPTAFAALDATQIAFNGQPLKQAVYVQVTQQIDVRQGTVRNYSILTTSLSNGGRTELLTVQITRSGAPYVVHLKLVLEGASWWQAGTWKIAGIDGI